jgi:hypothetical protein
MRAVEYANVKQQRTVDGGYSGPLIVTCADGKKGTAPLVFVDGHWLPTNLVLSSSEARELSDALLDAARAADGDTGTDQVSPRNLRTARGY